VTKEALKGPQSIGLVDGSFKSGESQTIGRMDRVDCHTESGDSKDHKMYLIL